MNNTNSLSANSILRVKFPPQIKLESPNCKINGAGVSFTMSVAGNRQVVDISLPNVVIAQYGLYSSYLIGVENVRNPDSFELSESFEVEL